jgi:4-hydroxy-4-methyl-2-oxoglutarate aldolase
MSIVVKQVERPSQHLVEEYKSLTASLVHEAIGREIANVMDPGIKPVWEGSKIVGPALTVQCFPADNLTIHKAVSLAQPSDVIVINAYGAIAAMWGSQMAFQAKLKGVAGVVIDGSARDIAELRNMNFPCFARYINPIGSAKANPGSINVPVQCGGVIVEPADIVIGDDDGVTVVPKEMASEVLKRARERESKEQAMREMFKEGKTSFDIYNFQSIFDKKGVKEI